MTLASSETYERLYKTSITESMEGITKSDIDKLLN